MKAKLLSKSKYLTGLQCPKALWLSCHQPDLKDPVDDATQAIFDQGTAIGILAQQVFPNGELIDEPYFELDKAVAHTQTALKNNASAIYEAAFIHDGVQVWVDILVNNNDGSYNIVEVKSSTSAKEVHEHDLAVQYYVLTQCGLKINKAYLMHINNQYEYDGNEYILNDLFSLADLTDEALELQDDVKQNLPTFKAMLDDTMPDVEISRHCKKPYVCSFYGHCHKNLPEYPIQTLPRLSEDNEIRLKLDGIRDIREIPDHDPLLREKPLYHTIKNVISTGAPHFSNFLKRELARYQFPLYFMDFEATVPALPLYKGTRPFQAIPFQSSIHKLDEDGTVTHLEHLAEGNDDPRQTFTTSLIESLGEEGSIVVYSSYEKRILTEMADLFPEQYDEITAIIERLKDLLDVVKNHTYHPKYAGSFSIKKVLPALVDGIGYDDLEIAGGSNAANAFLKLTDSTISGEERLKIRTNLLAYCKRDTEALMYVYQALRDK